MRMDERTEPVRRLVMTLVNYVHYAGRCNVCGHRGLFRIRSAAWDNLRENLACPRCLSISRDRFMAAVIAFCLARPPILAVALCPKGEWPGSPLFGYNTHVRIGRSTEPKYTFTAAGSRRRLS